MNFTQHRQLAIRTLSILATAAATGSALSQPVELVAEIRPGPAGSAPHALTEFNGDLCFVAYDGEHGSELWKFDGQTASMVADIYPGPHSSESRDFTEFDGSLYFYGYSDLVRGIWKYDGTTVSLAADVNPGTSGGGRDYFKVFDGNLYFESNDYLGGIRVTGDELWRYDGTHASRAFEIRAGGESYSPSYLTVFDGCLYWFAHMGGGVRFLCKYDGIDVSFVARGLRGPQYLTAFDGSLYFAAESSKDGGAELFRFDGHTVTEIEIRPGSKGSRPYGFTVFNGALYFSADDGVNGRELWQFDGTNASLVADINPSQDYSRSSDPTDLTVFNGALYFSADDGVHGRELWSFDGNTISLVADISPGPESSYPHDLTAFGGTLYFGANDGVNGSELWRLIPDIDGDGVPDEFDPFPNSDLRPTVIVGQVDSGVVNVLLPEGATVADLANSAVDVTDRSVLAYILNELKKEGWISGRDQGAILSASNRR